MFVIYCNLVNFNNKYNKNNKSFEKWQKTGLQNELFIYIKNTHLSLARWTKQNDELRMYVEGRKWWRFNEGASVFFLYIFYLIFTSVNDNALKAAQHCLK